MKLSKLFAFNSISMALAVVIGFSLCGMASADKMAGSGSAASIGGGQVDYLLGGSGGDIPNGEFIDFGAILDGGDSGKGGRSAGGGGVTKLVVIPEPASGLLLVTALGFLGMRRKRT